MARQYDVHDSEWGEVKIINGYALFMGYLMMGVRGLGLLIITWTTVVLLGGFVSDLGKKDFWCLTGITLIQTAGVFNFLLTEKLSDMVHLWWGLLGAAVGTVTKGKRKGKEAKEDDEDDEDISTIRIFLAVAVSAIQGIVLFVVLCPVAILYVFGLGISAGASLWRLIKHDFGSEGGANKKPALQVLYSLAVAQGVLFGYKIIHSFAAKTGLVKLVYNRLGKRVDEALVAEYLEETVAGCETKDPSFATGRNLVTYGVDLMMEAKSNEGFLAGIKVLGGAINEAGTWGRIRVRGKKVLAKYLLTSSRWDSSSSAIIQRLLETVGPRSPYSREIKEHVLRILGIIAPCIRLEQFPRAIECLYSVVGTSVEEYNQLEEKLSTLLRLYGDRFKDYERVGLLEEYEEDYMKYHPRNGSPDSFLGGILRDLLYKCLPCKTEEKVDKGRKENIIFDQLPVKAVNIIHKLVADEYNRSIIHTSVSNTTMLQKIIVMSPTKLHRENHYPYRWFEESESGLQMLEQCWVLTQWLISKEIEEEQLQVVGSMDGSALGITIKDNIERTIKSIFDCPNCRATQKRQAIQILLHLSLDNMSWDSERRLSWILLLILCSRDDSEYWMVPSLTNRNDKCFDFYDIRRLAGEKLCKLLPDKNNDVPSEASDERELQSVHFAVGDLKSAFYDDAISIRTHAIIIMEGLCDIWIYDRYSAVEEFLVDAIPEVVKETLTLCGSKIPESKEQTTDEEEGKVSQDNQDNGCTDTQRLRRALASLCYDGYMRNFEMEPKFKEIASKICEVQGKSFRDFKLLLNQYIK